MEFLACTSPQRSLFGMGNYSTFTVNMPCDSDYSFIILFVVFGNSKVPVTGLLEINTLMMNFAKLNDRRDECRSGPEVNSSPLVHEVAS